MRNKLTATVKKYNMLQRGDKIIVALSGGADSMCLLFLLKDLEQSLGISVSALHINHNIRGEEALRDMEFVTQYCKENSIELTVLQRDVPALAKQQGLSLEQAGRNVRYEIFEMQAEDSLIATAHNLNDCAETFLFNLSRGSSLKGLKGIPPKRGRIIRPLIECTKEEILSFCRETHLPFVTDSTNLSTEYTRNALRHNVVSELCRITPSFFTSFLRCTDSLKNDDDYLRQATLRLLADARQDDKYSVAVLKASHSAIRLRAIAEIASERANCTAESLHIRMIDEGLDGCCVNLPGGAKAVSDGCFLYIASQPMKAPDDVPLLPNENIRFGKYSIKAEILSLSEWKNLQIVDKNHYSLAIDFDTIKGQLMLTTRREGDCFRPVGRGCTKTLKKLFNEKKIDKLTRPAIPVLRDDLGIVAVYLGGIDERLRLTNSTKCIFAIKITEC